MNKIKKGVFVKYNNELGLVKAAARGGLCVGCCYFRQGFL